MQDNSFRTRQHHFFGVLPAALLIGNAAAACGASSPPAEMAAPQPYLDDRSSPPANEILPPHGVVLRGAPEILDAEALRGRWHAGACELVLSGDGLSGDARATGTCPPGLLAVARWEVEPEHRQRLSLVDHQGSAVWTGILGSDGTLAGLARQAGRVIFTR